MVIQHASTQLDPIARRAPLKPVAYSPVATQNPPDRKQVLSYVYPPFVLVIKPVLNLS
jgi:hypothetical protein